MAKCLVISRPTGWEIFVSMPHLPLDSSGRRSSSLQNGLNRREFLQTAGSIAFLAAVRLPGRAVSLVIDPADVVAMSAAAQWAAKEFARACETRGITIRKLDSMAQVKREEFCVLVAGAKSPLAVQILKRSRIDLPRTREALALVPGLLDKRRVLLVCGDDARGLVYALLDLTDRIHHASDPFEAIQIREAVVEQPANRVRSMMRLFASDVEDKPWYNDREMWPRYLTMLATQRFNRFNLSFGLGYDFLRRVTDAYFLFTYPFLLSVPGYNVRVPQLPEDERDRNLEMLKFIGRETVARGLEFQVGLWMHGYEWLDSPNAKHTVAGLTRAEHGPYCRDALRLLLQSCSDISGVTIRTHGESGVEEGSYDFWKTVFEGVATCGRKVEIDLHPKGLDQQMLENAIATRQAITVSPKFWAEHLGLPYHQADIRELEVPKAGKQTSRLMNLSEGSRSFMRYGYGDLLREGRSWGVIHRVWPGSQRLLLWGDPLTAAAYSRAFTFCGSDGAEICEPLSFKGRRGSGIAGDRCAYTDTTLRPRWDWEKYLYSYRIWGRLLYNPNADPDTWRRYLRHHFADATTEIESAMANASRILPTITTAHTPSAANNNYWPEMYLNHSLIDAEHWGSYSDSPAPRVFGNVSPLDPQLFSRINDFADELLTGEPGAKYSPVEVAQWIEDYAETATKHLTQAALDVRSKNSPEYRRLSIDVTLQAGLGHFFAAKFRSGVLYRLFEKTGHYMVLESCLDQYRKARTAWANLGNVAKDIYMSDVTVGEQPQQRGHWLDRLPAIDHDIAEIAAKLPGAKRGEVPTLVSLAVKEVLGSPQRAVLSCHHSPLGHFMKARPLVIDLSLETPVALVHLYYRHVNQAERFSFKPMEARENTYRATVPASYTDSPYPLAYYFEVRSTTGKALLYPGFSPGLTNQPYFVVRATPQQQL